MPLHFLAIEGLRIVGHALKSCTSNRPHTCTYMHTSIHSFAYPLLGTEEFLAAHPEWKLEQRFTNNSGLTILVRTPAA